MTDSADPVEPTTEVVAWLKQHRALVIVVPVGVAEDDVKALVREVNARLDELAAKRGKLQ
jgi:hypothetical protein